MQPRVIDNDQGEITVTLDGRELRGWAYANDTERRAKMCMARDYVEGWCDAIKHCAKIADAQADDDDRGTGRHDMAQENRELTPEELWQCRVHITTIQNACLHKHIDERPFSIDDKNGKRHYGVMRRCADCGMPNP